MDKLSKIFLALGGILFIVVIIEVVILLRNSNPSIIATPKITEMASQNKLTFETSTDIPSIQFGIDDQQALDTFA